MELKRAGFTFGGMNQDLGKSKYSPEVYYDAQHVRITTVEGSSTGLLTNEIGNELKFEIPDVDVNITTRFITYGDQKDRYDVVYKKRVTDLSRLRDFEVKSEFSEVIGHVATTDSVVLFVTNTASTVDMIFEVVTTGITNRIDKLKLLYIGELGFSTFNPIQAVFNYENENVQKVYWTDGKSQLRFINIKNDEDESNAPLFSLPTTAFNFVGNIDLTRPIIKEVRQGGNHTSGMIQYAYNLYNINRGESRISTVSDLIPLGKGEGLGGGDVNETVGASPVIQVRGLDRYYDYIKLYSIKYTSLGQLPTISLLLDEEIAGNTVEHFDDGTIIEEVPIEEFLFLESNPVTAKHIVVKDNRLLASNIKESSFDIPDSLDCRCYSYSTDGVAKVLASGDNWTDVLSFAQSSVKPNSEITIPANYVLDRKHNAINADYSIYRYDKDGNWGGEGKFFKYNIVQKTQSQIDSEEDSLSNNRYFKDDELYRLGIIFYNELGQESPPRWMADFKAPVGNMEGLYNTLEVEAKLAFENYIKNTNWKDSTDVPVGFSIVRADRKSSDRTILYSGILTDFVIQTPQTTEHDDEISRDFYSFEDRSTKIPTWLARTYQPYPYPENSPMMGDVKKGGILQGSIHGRGLVTEVFNEGSSRYKRQYSWVHSKMMQMYSPELLFNKDAVNLPTGLKLRIKGVLDLDKYETYYWGQVRDNETKETTIEGKIQGTLTPQLKTVQTEALPNGGVIDSKGVQTEFGPFDLNLPSIGLLRNMVNNHSTTWSRHAFIMPTRDEGTMGFDQYYREFNTFIKAPLVHSYDIYGSPEYVVRGKGPSSYNNDSRFRYTNSLESIMSDSASPQDHHPTITSVNSYSNNNLTMVLGLPGVATDRRYSLNDLFRFTGMGSGIDHSILYGEVVRPESDLYRGNMYGGNSYEAKKRTTYIKIGDYMSIRSIDTNPTVDKYVNNSPGDTFVQDFKFARITKTDKEIYSESTRQITEILKYPTETTIDLSNRNDESLGNWDDRWQPRDEEFHKYNKVYSQSSNLLKVSDLDHTFRRVNNFETRIQPTRVKYPNETIDNWTKFLPNESLELDGAFGPINNIVLFNDDLYSFQDSGIANIQVNPRVQIPTDDGVGLQLGTGGILPDYRYLTTTSGSINKYSIISGKRGIYYYDAYNSSVGRIPNETSYMLSESKGMQSFFNAYSSLSIMKSNSRAAIFAADPHNNDIYMTLLLKRNDFRFNPDEEKAADKSVTLVFNEALDQFIDSKTYKPNRYIRNNDRLFMTTDSKKFYESGVGEYNIFFDEFQSSHITLMLNPDVSVDKVFTNILYNSEVYLDDLEQPEKTLTHIHAWNEYQDTGRIPLVIGRNKNIRRKFRNWNADIPRDGRDRIRNPWIFLKLEFENEEGLKMILHDVIVTYIV